MLCSQCREKEQRRGRSREKTRDKTTGGLGEWYLNLQDFLCWERPREENFCRHLARERSRPTLTPRPFLQIHHRWMLPHYVLGVAARFGPIDPNIPVCSG